MVILQFISTMKSDSPLRVLVFGATGIGKTSLCNTISGRARPANSGAAGVTAKSHISSVIIDGRKIELFDTVGLHESSTGTVPAEKAFEHLIELLTSAKDGFNLLIHVARASRITKDQEDDYTFFFEKLSDKKIPIFLAVTGCENESPMSNWVDQNRQHFHRFEYKTIVSTCCAIGGPLEDHYAPLRASSRADLLAAISAHALKESHRLYGEGTGSTFEQTLSRLWNFVVDLTGLSEKWRSQVNESAYDLIKRIGLSEEVAGFLVKHIPDIAQEMGNKLPYPGSGRVVRKVVERIVQFVFRASPSKGK